MLTEQDIAEAIQKEQYGDINPYKAAQTVYNKHLAECERLMEIAFKAAKEKRYESDFPYPLDKFRTFKDYKESLT